jgi:hypothetical protein
MLLKRMLERQTWWLQPAELETMQLANSRVTPADACVDRERRQSTLQQHGAHDDLASRIVLILSVCG